MLANCLAVPFYAAHADLIPEIRARQLATEDVRSEQHKTQPLQRLRDTVFQADVQWPSAPDRPFEKDASLPLEAMTLDADPDTRVQGLLGLADAQSPNTISRLAAALDDPDLQVRETALEKLAILDPGRLVQELVLRLDSPDGAYSAFLEEALPALKQRLERPLLALLRDGETAYTTRIVAVRVLGLMGSERAVHELSSLAFQPGDTNLALAATQALALVASPDALPALKGLTLHPSPGIRTEALHGLARIGGPIALSAIEAMALNPRENNARIRREAIAYIGLMGADPSIDVLISVMNRYPQTREEVVAALRRLTGLNLGNSPLEWTQWRYKQQKAREEAQEEAPPSVGILGIIPGASGQQPPQ
ncbi:MAG TPA: HEAT repeat domain-containing protein [Candidatus Hydrogenedentes bacterium]|jgi:HEAT repeat protein|nr:HEAT repeat domain-containing protein [Candidatus Hydrogenedentota bacterium]